MFPFRLYCEVVLGLSARPSACVYHSFFTVFIMVVTVQYFVSDTSRLWLHSILSYIDIHIYIDQDWWNNGYLSSVVVEFSLQSHLCIYTSLITTPLTPWSACGKEYSCQVHHFHPFFPLLPLTSCSWWDGWKSECGKLCGIQHCPCLIG